MAGKKTSGTSVVAAPVARSLRSHPGSVFGRPDRNELQSLGAALLAGILLRWLHLDHLAIEHHDEAVYASNLLFGPETGYQFPGRPFYAPPLLPLLIEWTTILWRGLGLPATSWLPMLPGLLAGTALIPSVWWVARSWFSPTAGLATAWLVALSEYHAFYSRTALTDPLVVLWMLWSVHWAWIALGNGSLKGAGIAGFFTALAWWTKYNGWLPVAIAVSGGLCQTLMLPRSERRWRELFAVLGVMTGSAVLLWLPVLADCAAVGGYSAVAANHRGYLQGWTSWGSNWIRQNANVAWYSGPLTLASWLVAAGVVCCRRSVNTSLTRLPRSARSLAVGSVGLVLVASGYPLMGMLWWGTWGVVWGLLAWRTGTLPVGEQRGACLLAVWFTGLCLTLPLYQPYPRLAMPLWLAGCLGAGWWLHRTASTASATNEQKAHNAVGGWSLRLGGVVAGCVAVIGIVRPQLSPAWERRDSLHAVARQLRAESSHDPARTVVFVYGDPGLFFELTQAGFAAAPRGDLHVARSAGAEETLLIPGWNADRQTDFRERWSEIENQVDLLHQLPVVPSSLVLLDQDTPGVVRSTAEGTSREYRVYSVR